MISTLAGVETTVQFRPLLTSGAIKPSIYKVLPIEKEEEAHSILERSENIGKVVLQVFK